jgi:mRNA-degrading endonuclease toxin of MazEF toxin-antitoxin module
VELQQGSIVWVRVNDSAGRNPKCRPAVVVTPTREITENVPLVVVAVTTTIPDPRPDNYIALQWHRGKHPVTGLRVACCAVCDWLIEIEQSAIEQIGGITPPAVLAAILERIPQEPPE